MEFHEKLLELRRQKGLTQEELAQALYVSRTAVSKWESGRGYPNIDSLKQIAKFFCVSIDTLLSSQEMLTVAEDDHKQTHARFLDLIYGLCDLSAASFLFLPFFRYTSGEAVNAVSLLSLTGVASYLRLSYLTIVIAMVALGILALALQTCSWPIWLKLKRPVSLLLNTIGALIFIISSQPYAAASAFLLLLFKLFLLAKKQ
ncbi:MAG: helix-turn-helix transcriptional regulator [Ruminococcaceae bacterium]|nr:helix-turn-helix transcriptional regulator [Oscillospiraceae bacterium]